MFCVWYFVVGGVGCGGGGVVDVLLCSVGGVDFVCYLYVGFE